MFYWIAVVVTLVAMKFLEVSFLLLDDDVSNLVDPDFGRGVLSSSDSNRLLASNVDCATRTKLLRRVRKPQASVDKSTTLPMRRSKKRRDCKRPSRLIFFTV